MLIYLLRHGLTEYNAQKRYQGQRDIPLSAEGLRQQALADGEELLVILAHGGTQMAAMERYVLPRRGYYEWCGPNAGGYVLDAADWAEKRQLRLVRTVQYTKDAEADA